IDLTNPKGSLITYANRAIKILRDCIKELIVLEVIGRLNISTYVSGSAAAVYVADVANAISNY
ncbi:19846_t:CDS:2, partial [Funneliformis geosporum]